ncbi:MAG: hypothetical protein N2038_08865 [Geminicoccaceae bacterium]|nr:hypothetical protein [Geminicoccaceae bacterium]
MHPRLVLAVLIALLLAAGGARARTASELEPARSLCAEAAARVEREEGLPPGILQAIALAESARWDGERGRWIAWPWTVNAGGEAAQFATREEAVAHVRELRARGRTNIDVGCMQVNLGWHPAAFSDLETAFDPLANATYAAAFLATLYEEAGSWELAVERYHSRDPDRGRGYRERVFRLWAGLGGGPEAIEPKDAARGGGRIRAVEPRTAPLRVVPVHAAAVERAALRAMNRLEARATWRWLALRLPLPSLFLPSPPAEVAAALDPNRALPERGAVVAAAALSRPLVFAGPSRPAVPAAGRVPGPWPRASRPQPFWRAAPPPRGQPS